MCWNDPSRRRWWGVARILAWLGAASVALAQTTASLPQSLTPDWRRIGNSAFDASLASAATGPVDRVWFSEGGSRLFLRTASGHYFETEDLENWKAQAELVAPVRDSSLDEAVPRLPEAGARVRSADSFNATLYAFGRELYKSEDGGQHWADLTNFRGKSIIGDGFLDIAIPPTDSNVIVAANRYGVWRSEDGGLSWSGLNDTLPNLPIRQVLQPPSGTQGTLALLTDGSSIEWAPGEKQSWRPAEDASWLRQEIARKSASAQLNAEITAISVGKEYSYAGAADGRLWVSSDQGTTWQLSRLGAGTPVAAIFVSPEGPRVVLVSFGAPSSAADRTRVLRSLDGGNTWEDLTGNLPAVAVRGVTADQSGAAVYVAAGDSIYFTLVDSSVAGPTVEWRPMSGSLPHVPAMDVRLDDTGTQLYVALDGYGVYSAPAPHRFLTLNVVNAADFSRRPAAPGSLLTVLGGRLLRAQAGLLQVPVLVASEAESQIQVPFEVTGNSTRLALELSRGRFTVNMPVQEVSPAIFVDRDGSALLLDGVSGVLLDGLTPAHAGGRVQILATGLGKVQPPWPTGMTAPFKEPPAVVARMRAFLDRAPIEVTRATLAPGYVGFYLVEVQLPSVVNAGPAELYLEADGHASNRVRINLEP